MYQSLYRKYRPETFKRIVGQKSIVQILRNSIKNGKISHAYMFSGPRGTGKTSTAKILAKTVNCLDLKDGISCEKCEHCKEINSGISVDIIEIDAASNNGVDEIRELRNNINLACSSLKYKVYIIDEVHMLSIGAFNALLKTLEEPPERVIFILATTDPQKVPTTMVSRCQCYHFQQISINDIVSNLNYICEQEKFSISKDILEKIAITSNGGMRDAIGLLEKASLYGDKIKLEDFNELCGFVTDEDLEEFIKNLVEYNTEKTLSIIDKKYLEGINLITFFNQCIDKIRDMLFKNITDEKMIHRYSECILLLNDVSLQLRSSSNPRGLALAFIGQNLSLFKESDRKEKETKDEDFLDASLKMTSDSFHEEKQILEEKTKKPVKPKEKITVKDESFQDVYVDRKCIINNTFATASKEKLEDLKKKWEKLNSYILDSNYGSNVSFLLDGSICAVGDKNFIYAFHYPSLVNRANEMYTSLIETIKNLLEVESDIAFLSDEEWEQEKNAYISKLKSGEKYVWQEPQFQQKNDPQENKNENKTDDISPSEIFGQDVVEYE